MSTRIEHLFTHNTYIQLKKIEYRFIVNYSYAVDLVIKMTIRYVSLRNGRTDCSSDPGSLSPNNISKTFFRLSRISQSTFRRFILIYKKPLLLHPFHCTRDRAGESALSKFPRRTNVTRILMHSRSSVN